MTFAYSNILETHGAHLLPAAAMIALIGGLVTSILYQYARRAGDIARWGWTFLTGVAAGTMIWTTHFVAMLAYDPGCATAYDPLRTSLSFFIAVAASTAGVAIATGGGGLRPAAGGTILGLGVAAMHYTGISALSFAGWPAWNPLIVLASVIVAAAPAALAFLRLHERKTALLDWPAGLLLAFSVCGLHFLGMAALVVTPIPDMVLVPRELQTTILGYIVTTLALMVAATGVSTVLIARQAQRQASTNLRDVADAAVEGLVLTDGERILDVNRSFAELSGISVEDLDGRKVRELIGSPDNRMGDTFEAVLAAADGPIPVEVIVRPSHLDIAESRILAVRDLRERRAAEERIRYLAHFDTLTGLPNRALFREQMTRALEAARHRGTSVAVMVLDLDHFKEVNDIYGHAAGDELLRKATRRLQDILSEHEFAARIGGDEFVILQTDLPQPGAACALANKLPYVFREPFDIGGRRIEAGMTIGAAVFPRDGATPQQLLANADLALYRAKQEGRGSACFFTSEMDEIVRARRVLSKELRIAVEAGGLELHYQPQVALVTGEVVGFEALVRWPHPVRGLVPPADFIPIAEETDLIFSLGEWALRAACREAAGWSRPCRVAVNLSPIQFRQPGLQKLIADVLEETGLEPGRLEIEITESTLIGDPDRVKQMLGRIRKSGVRIALDDFGTGFSSLSTLQSFPFDKIKIDKSFVGSIGDGEQSTVIVNAILGLGRSMSIPVVAEGVETEVQRRFLRRAGCAEAQGYMFGRAMPIDAFADIVHPPSIGLAEAS